MNILKKIARYNLLLLCYVLFVNGDDETTIAIKRVFSACKRSSPDFDACMKRAFNKLRPFFKIGIPDIGVAPFDPHFANEVNQTRGFNNFNYKLTLKNVYERGWTRSTVTNYKTEWKNEMIVYSQYFPEKWLEGSYEFRGNALGAALLRAGIWNMTLRDYSQTTKIKRLDDGSVDVQVAVDKIGDMELHVSNLLRGSSFLESMLDRIINLTWRPGFAMVKPLINDLVSTAFTEIWSNSFKTFKIDDFIPE